VILARKPIELLFAAAVLTGLIVGSWSERTGAYKALARQHSTALASVASTDCHDHSRVNYTFRVRDKGYAGTTYWLNKPCDQVMRGDTFAVNFDPVDPNVNTTMAPQQAYDFHRRRRNNLLLIAVLVFGYTLYPQYRKWQDRKFPVSPPSDHNGVA
jgi:hypothetical protein